MKEFEYRQLVENVRRDGCLTSVPFVYPCEDDWDTFEVLSGNHRTRAAIEAGLEEIEVMSTHEELTNDQKLAIQLSHNSISGQDDMAILKDLYEQIQDVSYKAYSGLDDETLQLLEKVGNQSMSSINLDFQILSMVVLPTELGEAMKTIAAIKKEVGNNPSLTMRFSEYDKWLDSLDEVGSATGIKNTATAMFVMLDLVSRHMEDLKAAWKDSAPDKQWIPVSTIVGRNKVQASDARVIDKAVEKMIARGEVKKGEKEKAFALMAAAYLDDTASDERQGRIKKQKDADKTRQKAANSAEKSEKDQENDDESWD